MSQSLRANPSSGGAITGAEPSPAGAPGLASTPCGQAGGPGGRTRIEHGALPFVIQRDGTWLYRGSPIKRKELVCLFSGVLSRDEGGDFWLETPVERGRIQVEDTPWIAVELNWTGCGKGRNQCLTFRTNVDQIITAGPEHRIRVAHNALTCEPIPYLHIRDGLGEFPLEARISRAVYYELVALAEEGCCGGNKCLGVWSSGCFFPLGNLPGTCDG